MNDWMHVACPHCNAVNRLPAARLGDAPSCGRCKQSLFTGSPLVLDAARFGPHQRADLPLLVDFWAPWCGPCRTMAPHFEAAAGALEPRVRLARLDTEAEPELGGRFGIRSIPTLILFRQGQELARQSGAMDKSGIVRWTIGHLT